MSGQVAHKRAWSKADDSKLRKLSTERTWAEIALMLGRTRFAVQARARVLGLFREQARPWTEGEIEVLRRDWPFDASESVAASIDRTVSAVNVKAREIGLRKDPEYLRAVQQRAAQRRHHGTAAFHQQRAGRFDREGGEWSPTLDAVRFLQRVAPIWRCDAEGAFDPKGACWKFGGKVMDAAAVEARAPRSGWVRP